MKESLVIVLLKNKGVSTLCNNYRTISLLNIITKLSMRLVINRMTPWVEGLSDNGITTREDMDNVSMENENEFFQNLLPVEQVGFRSNLDRRHDSWF